MPAFRYQNGDRPLDGFTIQHGLGRGGFGEVYYAVSDSGREVALKVVQNYEEVELRGIGHCMNLKSPHLVTIFDVKYNDRKEPFVIMEYVSGPSLREVLDDAPNGIGATKAAFFLRELAKGLTYLHDNGVVHRDMKPHNVFFEDGIVKIGDYSLSKIISTSHRSGHTMTVGTVHYMAPEIGMGRYDSRVDIYALGIMLYEMLVGQPPFVGESMGEVIMKHVTADPDLSMIEEPFARTIKRALAKDPEDRFASAAEMVESVFGAAHVKNSVTEFNPMELSVVAEKVARKAVPAGGISSNGMNMSPAAMPTEVYGRSHDSTENNANVALTAEVINDSPVAAGVRLASIVPQERSRSENVVGQLIDYDALSHSRRVVLTLVCLLAIAAYVVTFSTGFVAGARQFWGFFVPMLCCGASISWLARKLSGRLTGHSFAKRVGIIMLSGLGVWVVLIVILRFSTIATASPTWMIGVLPLLAVNWSKKTATDRESRADLKLALLCAGGSLLLAWVFRTDEVATIGLTVGSVFAAQMLSPFHRLSVANESMAGRYPNDRNKGKSKAAIGQHAAAHVQAAAAQVAEKLAEAEPRRVYNPETDSLNGEDTDAVELEASPHNQATILILNLIYLLFPLGGLHRLAVGRVVSGIIWLLTGGLFFVGQIYDAVMIVTGQFKDSEGRIVGPPQKSRPTPVNHLSSVPASGKSFHLGALALNAIGIAGVFIACATVLGSIVLTGCSLIEHKIYDDIANALGSQKWPEITHQVAVIIAVILVVISSVCFMFARRHHNAKHVLRALAGPLLICAGFIMTWFAVDEVSWPTVLANVVSGSPAAAIQDSLLDDDFLRFFGVAAVTCLAGASILAWPARKTPTMQSEIQA